MIRRVNLDVEELRSRILSDLDGLVIFSSSWSSLITRRVSNEFDAVTKSRDLKLDFLGKERAIVLCQTLDDVLHLAGSFRPNPMHRGLSVMEETDFVLKQLMTALPEIPAVVLEKVWHRYAHDNR